MVRVVMQLSGWGRPGTLVICLQGQLFTTRGDLALGWKACCLTVFGCLLYFRHSSKCFFREFPGGPVAKTPNSNCRVPGLIFGQGTRSHMLQLRLHTCHGRTCVLQLRPGAAKQIKININTNCFFFFFFNVLTSLILLKTYEVGN